MRWLAVVVAVALVRAQHPLDFGRGGNAAPSSLDERLTVEDSGTGLNVDSSMMVAADALEDRLAQSEHEIEKLRAQDEATDERIEQLESRMQKVSTVQTSAHAKINAIHEHVMAAKAAAQGANSAAQGTLKLAEVLSTAHKAFKRTLITVESSAAGAAASAVITHGGDAESATASASAAIHSASSLATDSRIVDPMVLATAAAAAASRAALASGMNKTTAIAVAADTAVATMHALGAAHVEAGAAAYLSAKAAGASDAEADEFRLGATALYDSLSDGASTTALADALANAVTNPSLTQLAAVAEQAAKHATSLLAQHRANAANKLVSVAAITAALSVMNTGTSTYSAHALADLAAQAAVKAALSTIRNHADADAVVQGSASAGSVVTKIGSGGAPATEHSGLALAPDDGSPLAHHAQAWAAGFAAEAVLSSGGSQTLASDCAHAAALAIEVHDRHQSLDRDADRLKRLRGPVAYAAGSAAAVAARPHLSKAQTAAVAASTASAVTVVLGGSPTEAAGVAASAAYQAGGGTTASIAAASKARLVFPLARFEIMRHAIAAGDRAALRHASSEVAQGARVAGMTAQRYISAAQAYGVRGGVAGTAAALWTLRHGGSEASASATAAAAAALAMISGSAALDGTTVIASASSTAGSNDGGSSHASVRTHLPGGESVNASSTAGGAGGSDSHASTSTSHTSGYASTQSATSAAVAAGASPEQASRAAANAAAAAKLAETGNLTQALVAAATAACDVMRLSGADPRLHAATWVESIARLALEHGLNYAEALAETRKTLVAHAVLNAKEVAGLVHSVVGLAAQDHTARTVAQKALLKGTDPMDAAQQARDAILAMPNSTKQKALEGAAMVSAKVAVMHGQLQAQAITTITNSLIALGMSPVDAEHLATGTLAQLLSLDPAASAAHAAHAAAHGGATVADIAKAAADAASRATLKQGLTVAEGARAAAAAVLAAGGSAAHAQNAAADAATSISVQSGLSDDAVARAVHVAVVAAGGTETQAQQKASQAASEARAYDALNCRQKVTVLATGTVAARVAKLGGTKEQVEFIATATAHAALQMLAHATGPCSTFTGASPHSVAAGLAAAVASAASTSKLSPDAVAHLSTTITANVPCAMHPGMCEHSTSSDMAVEMTLLNSTAPKALAAAQVAANAVLHMGEQTKVELNNAAEVAAVASKASASVALAASTSLAPGVSRSVSLDLQAAAASLVGLLHGDYNPFMSEPQVSKLTAELAVAVVVPKIKDARARADVAAASLKAKQAELAAARAAETQAVHRLASARSATERAAAQAALQLAKARAQTAELDVTKAMQAHAAASGLALSLEQAHEAVAAASAKLTRKQVQLAAAQAAEQKAIAHLEQAQTGADRAAAQAAVARAKAVTAAAQEAVEQAELAKGAAFEAAVAAHVEATVVVTAENMDAFAQANLPRACGMPPVPEHGIGIGMGFVTNSVGTVVEFRCHAHYVLVGSSTRTCRDDHLWSGDVAFCAESTRSPTPVSYMTFPPTPAPSPAPTPAPRCPQLAALPHGTVSATGTMPGDKVFYECQQPYELVGPNSASCHRDLRSHTGASWSSRPQCIKDVEVCSHVKCVVAEHSVHHAVRLEVDHGQCVNTGAPLSSKCREQHGDMHHCAYDLATASCVCRCWHKQVLDTNVYAHEDLSALSVLSPLSALRDTVI